MPNLPISGLPSGTPTGDALLPQVSGGVTQQITQTQFLEFILRNTASSSNSIYVSPRTGTDYPGNGGIVDPFYTVSFAFYQISGAELTNPFTVTVSGGQTNETNQISLLPFVNLKGETQGTIINNTNPINVDSSWGSEEFEFCYIQDIIINNDLNLDFSSITPNPGNYIQINNSEINGNTNFYGFLTYSFGFYSYGVFYEAVSFNNADLYSMNDEMTSFVGGSTTSYINTKAIFQSCTIGNINLSAPSSGAIINKFTIIGCDLNGSTITLSGNNGILNIDSSSLIGATIVNSGSNPFTINYIDRAESEYANQTRTNYTPTSATVEGNFQGIDSALGDLDVKLIENTVYVNWFTGTDSPGRGGIFSAYKTLSYAQSQNTGFSVHTPITYFIQSGYVFDTGQIYLQPFSTITGDSQITAINNTMDIIIKGSDWITANEGVSYLENITVMNNLTLDFTSVTGATSCTINLLNAAVDGTYFANGGGSLGGVLYLNNTASVIFSFSPQSCEFQSQANNYQNLTVGESSQTASSNGECIGDTINNTIYQSSNLSGPQTVLTLNSCNTGGAITKEGANSVLYSDATSLGQSIYPEGTVLTDEDTSISSQYTPTNFTPTTPTVNGMIAGIDEELGNIELHPAGLPGSPASFSFTVNSSLPSPIPVFSNIVTTSAGLNISLPSIMEGTTSQLNVGQGFIIFNAGSNSFNLHNVSGGTVQSNILPNTAIQFFVETNNTTAGTFSAEQPIFKANNLNWNGNVLSLGSNTIASGASGFVNSTSSVLNALGTNAAILAGSTHNASFANSAILYGNTCVTSASNTLAGGINCKAVAAGAIALGNNAQPNGVNSYSWADGQSGTFATSTANSYTIRASGGVGINQANPDPSAALDIASTTSGFLPPRMTSTQRLAISTPASGLIVYDTTANCYYYWNATEWTPWSQEYTFSSNWAGAFTLTPYLVFVKITGNLISYSFPQIGTVTPSAASGINSVSALPAGYIPYQDTAGFLSGVNGNLSTQLIVYINGQSNSNPGIISILAAPNNPFTIGANASLVSGSITGYLI